MMLKRRHRLNLDILTLAGGSPFFMLNSSYSTRRRRLSLLKVNSICISDPKAKQ